MDERPVRSYVVDRLRVVVCPTVRDAGRAAARDVAASLRRRIAADGRVRLVLASAPSQDQLLAGLAAADGVDWGHVEAFHVDEYVGLGSDDPRGFGRYLVDRLFTAVRPGRVELIGSDGAPDELAERYAKLLAEGPLHVGCLGIGENGHLAFNEPGDADFADSAPVRAVALSARSRQQQVNDGCFGSLDQVPAHAVTVTVPALMAIERIACVVPGPRKAEAVRRTLAGPVDATCPASALRLHPDATLYLDPDSAALS